MVDEIKRLLAICDEEHLSLFLQAEHSLKGLVNIVPLGRPWTAYTEVWIKRENLLALQFASVTLSRNFPEPVISGSEIDLIRIQLNELFATISAASIHDRLKKLVLESLAGISRALAEYELRGAKGLDDALSLVIGRGVLHAEFAETANQQSHSNAASDADEQNWQSGFWALMTRIATGINAAESVKRFTLMMADAQKNPPAETVLSLSYDTAIKETQ